MHYKVRIKDKVEQFAKELFYFLFDSKENQEIKIVSLKGLFLEINQVLLFNEGATIWNSLISQLPDIRKKLDLDAVAALENDPAANSLEEIYLAYPGFYAIAIYRLSHELYTQMLPIIPRIMSEYAHRHTGTDIHPGAQIGESFFIDHATGIVIGQTAIIKNKVKIYQGVTLGGIQVSKSLSTVKRHPTIEDNVTIYANATILGGDVIIGENTIIGANVCITKSVQKNSVVVYQSENIISKRRR